MPTHVRSSLQLPANRYTRYDGSPAPAQTLLYACTTPAVTCQAFPPSNALRNASFLCCTWQLCSGREGDSVFARSAQQARWSSGAFEIEFNEFEPGFLASPLSPPEGHEKTPDERLEVPLNRRHIGRLDGLFRYLIFPGVHIDEICVDDSPSPPCFQYSGPLLRSTDILTVNVSFLPYVLSEIAHEKQVESGLLHRTRDCRAIALNQGASSCSLLVPRTSYCLLRTSKLLVVNLLHRSATLFLCTESIST